MGEQYYHFTYPDKSSHLTPRLAGNAAELAPSREDVRPALPAPVAEGLVHDGEVVGELDLGLHGQGEWPSRIYTGNVITVLLFDSVGYFSSTVGLILDARESRLFCFDPYSQLAI